MGVVYKARDQALDRVVAIKLILGLSVPNADALNRFLAEAAGRRPSVASRVGLRLPVRAMRRDALYRHAEFIEGGSLLKKMRSTGTAIQQAVKLVVQLATRAMQVAHEAGIIHHDLKPANILVDKSWNLKISDFGLALRSGRPDASSGIAAFGTRGYMSPEQAAGNQSNLGPPTDIYALGVILYQLLTGELPISPERDTYLRQVRTASPDSPAKRNPKVSRDLETICLKCLEKARADRYASAGELGDDLERFLRYEPIKARPANAIEKTIKWVRRQPVRAGLLAGLLAAVLVAAGNLLVDAQRIEATRGATAARGRTAETGERDDQGGEGRHPPIKASAVP